ncbi:MAG: OmpH family outer membrane protein [Nitrospirae bacterium]|nr:MAG: OmpH family outer membrane protein [Nitrospirota bacterium]
MRGWGRWLIAAGAVVLLHSHAAGSVAAEVFKVGVMDQQAVVERTKAGKRALETLKEFTAGRQRIISSDDEEMKAMEKALKDQESGLSEAAKREKQEQFRKKFEAYQARLQEFNREIQQKQKEVGDEYMGKIKQVAADVAQKEGYAAILDKGHENTLKIVLYHSAAVDLTDLVVKEFDKRYK